MLWNICRFSLKFFFKKIEIEGLENVPQSGPVILAPNHQNTFLDAVLVACALRRPVFSLTRGDVFKNGLVKKLLHSLHMMPIYRFKDGHGAMRKNAGVFQTSLNVLDNGNALLIFPEGNHAQHLRLRPLQKGCARLVYKFITEGYGQELPVVPVGINYYRHRSSGGKLYLNIGKPLLYTKAFVEKQAERETLDEITAELTHSLRSLLVHIPEEGYSAVYALWQEKRQVQRRVSVGFQHDVTIISEILSEGEIVETRQDAQESRKPLNIWLLPIRFWYELNHFIPKKFMHWLIQKVVKDLEFSAAVLFGLGTVLIPFVYILQSIVVLVFFGSWAAVLYLISLPISRLIYLKFSKGEYSSSPLDLA